MKVSQIILDKVKANAGSLYDCSVETVAWDRYFSERTGIDFATLLRSVEISRVDGYECERLWLYIRCFDGRQYLMCMANSELQMSEAFFNLLFHNLNSAFGSGRVWTGENHFWNVGFSFKNAHKHIPMHPFYYHFEGRFSFDLPLPYPRK